MDTSIKESKTILVIGATGMLGKPVAKQLLKDGFHVRVLARNPQKAQQILGDGFEICAGDVTDSLSLRAALKDVDGVHISLKGGPSEADFERMDHHATRDIAQLAKESGTERITLLSAYAERWVRTVREECLDHILIISAAHLRRILLEFAQYYNVSRPHQGIEQQMPIPSKTSIHTGPIRRRKVLGGIINNYYRSSDCHVPVAIA